MVRRHVHMLVSALVLVLAAPACGGSSSPGTGSAHASTANTTADPGRTASCDAGEVPEGTWDGPVVVSATGTPTAASGAVYNSGGGSIHLVIKNHQVESGRGTFNASSSGTVATPAGGTAEIHGTLSMTDGVVSGSARDIRVTGTATQSGSMLITVSGVRTNAPLKGTVPLVATLTVRSVSCSHVTATYLPDLNSKTQGKGVFSGTAEWRADRV